MMLSMGSGKNGALFTFRISKSNNEQRLLFLFFMSLSNMR